LDYVYLRDSGEQAVSDLGLSLFSVSTEVPIAQAVRERSIALASAISERAEIQKGPLHVASLAAGHLRELDHIPAHVAHRIQMWALDQDERSLEACVSRWPPDLLVTRHASIRDVIVGCVRMPRAHVVYASGLFDYLDDCAASLLIRRMVASLRPGGIALVPNLTPSNPEIAYMEAIMDWWMVYRTTDDLMGLVDTGQEVAVESYTSSDGRVAWLRLAKSVENDN